MYQNVDISPEFVRLALDQNLTTQASKRQCLGVIDVDYRVSILATQRGQLFITELARNCLVKNKKGNVLTNANKRRCETGALNIILWKIF